MFRFRRAVSFHCFSLSTFTMSAIENDYLSSDDTDEHNKLQTTKVPTSDPSIPSHVKQAKEMIMEKSREMTDSDEENQRMSTATLLFNLAGSLCFIAGSVGFIMSTWTIKWLLPLQFGCTLWCTGCILFLIPLLALLKTRCSHRNADSSSPTCASSCWSRSELCLVGCLLCFLVGCGFGTHFSKEETVVRFTPSMNALFLAGSALIFVDSLVVMYSHRTRICTSLHKLVACTCCRDGDGDDSPHGCVGLVVAGSYVFACILGGYGQSQGVIRAGMFGWIVGSVVSLLETIPELYQRRMDNSRDNPTLRKRVSTTRKPESSKTSAV
jgi:hypothetical protein